MDLCCFWGWSLTPYCHGITNLCGSHSLMDESQSWSLSSQKSCGGPAKLMSLRRWGKEGERERELLTYFFPPAGTAWTDWGASLVIVQLSREVLLPQTTRDLLQGPSACCLGPQPRHHYPLFSPQLNCQQGIFNTSNLCRTILFFSPPFQCVLACFFVLFTVFFPPVDAPPSLSEASLLPSLYRARLLLTSQHRWQKVIKKLTFTAPVPILIMYVLMDICVLF